MSELNFTGPENKNDLLFTIFITLFMYYTMYVCVMNTFVAKNNFERNAKYNTKSLGSFEWNIVYWMLF